MFYDRFKQLCDAKGVSCNKAAAEIGLSNATPTKWKKTGATPTGDTLEKIAEYFDISVDYLLLGEQDNRQMYEVRKAFREFIALFPETPFSERIEALFRFASIGISDISEKIRVPTYEMENWFHGKYPNTLDLNEFLSFWGLSRNEIFNKSELVEFRKHMNHTAKSTSRSRDVLDEIDVAFYGDFKQLSDDDKETVRDMVRVMRERRSRSQGK